MPFKDPAREQEYRKEYQKKNAEKIKAYLHEYHKKRRETMRDELNGESKAWRLAHPESVKESADKYRMRIRFGITMEEYQAILVSQDSKCACCNRTEDQNALFKGRPRKFAVDHDHATGKIRGLLCHSCNIGIGSLGDTLEGVKKAVEYLERAKQQSSQGTAKDCQWPKP